MQKTVYQNTLYYCIVSLGSPIAIFTTLTLFLGLAGTHNPKRRKRAPAGLPSHGTAHSSEEAREFGSYSIPQQTDTYMLYRESVVGCFFSKDVCRPTGILQLSCQHRGLHGPIALATAGSSHTLASGPKRGGPLRTRDARQAPESVRPP